MTGVYGVRAWGSYYQTGVRVRVSVCVEDTARSVYGAAAVGLAVDSSYRYHDNVGAVTIGYDRTQCHAMTARYTSHLAVEALSAYQNARSASAASLSGSTDPPDPNTHECGTLPNLSGPVPRSLVTGRGGDRGQFPWRGPVERGCRPHRARS